jgi:hypothetical protein
VAVVESESNEKQFTLVFSKESSRDQESLNLEAYTKTEAIDICKKLKYLIDFYIYMNRVEKRNERKSVLYSPLDTKSTNLNTSNTTNTNTTTTEK